MPKSAIQTEPRSARGMAGFFLVQGAEQFVSQSDQCALRQVAFLTAGDATEKRNRCLMLVSIRQGVERVENLLYGCGH
jgi:hypothetical protein